MEEAGRERLSGFHTFSTPRRGMEMTAGELADLRLQFSVAERWNDWTAEDVADIGAEIRSAIVAGDEAQLQWWRDWLADMSGLQRLGDLCRAAEARIKAERRKAA